MYKILSEKYRVFGNVCMFTILMNPTVQYVNIFVELNIKPVQSILIVFRQLQVVGREWWRCEGRERRCFDENQNGRRERV